MSEVIKTAILAGVTLLISFLAFFTLPGDTRVADEDIVGQPLFPDFNDVAEVKSLEVIQFNDELGELRSFEVTQEPDGRWVIPSHDNYEADAGDRITNAATLLVDLEVINKISEEVGDQETYGVVEPDKEKIRAGDKGIGKQISMKDANGNKLAQIIVGKPVADQEGQRYVRKPGNNVIYVVNIDPDQVSTQFADWIEQSVLQISDFDIETMRIRDYSVDPRVTATGQLAVNYDQRLDMTVKWVDDSSEWNLVSLREFRGGELRDTPLLPNETLSKEALDGMKSALGDLKVVDVQPKPPGLGADLKADKGFMEAREGIESLLKRGYFPVPLADGKVELLSSDGEVMAATRDGVRCTLRFGGIASVQREGDDEGNVNRFVMITADVDMDRFERPELPDLSEAVGDTTDKDAAAEDATGEDTAEKDTANKDTANKDTANKDTANKDTANESTGEKDAAPADAGGAGDESVVDGKGDSSDSQTSDSEASSESKDSADDSKEKQEERAAEQDAKLKEYQRQLDDYNEKIAKAKKKVRDLNYRFADWYYVVSEDVYKKIHLSRANVVVEEKATETEGTGVDAFRALEAEGLQRDEPQQGATPPGMTPPGM